MTQTKEQDKRGAVMKRDCKSWGARRGMSPRGRTATGGAAVVLTGVAILVTAGAAIAYLTSSGNASGAASTSTVSPLSGTTATASTTSELYPGGSADLTFKVTNPNSHSVTITAISLASTATGCTTPHLSLTPGLSFSVPANTTATETLHNAVSMATDASNDCQGATLTVPLSLSGKLS